MLKKRWISLTEEIHSLSNSLIVVDSLSVDRSISSISTKFRTNSFFSSWDLWSFRRICFRFLYNINSVLYIVRELHNFRITDLDIEIGLTKITSFIWYSWFTVIGTFVINCLYCQMPCYGLHFIWILHIQCFHTGLECCFAAYLSMQWHYFMINQVYV